MCLSGDILFERAVEQGTKLKHISSLMKNLHFTAEEAMRALSIPEDQWEEYKSLLQKWKDRL